MYFECIEYHKECIENRDFAFENAQGTLRMYRKYIENASRMYRECIENSARMYRDCIENTLVMCLNLLCVQKDSFCKIIF